MPAAARPPALNSNDLNRSGNGLRFAVG